VRRPPAPATWPPSPAPCSRARPPPSPGAPGIARVD
jgi:hypothetical protein